VPLIEDAPPNEPVPTRVAVSSTPLTGLPKRSLTVAITEEPFAETETLREYVASSWLHDEVAVSDTVPAVAVTVYVPATHAYREAAAVPADPV